MSDTAIFAGGYQDLRDCAKRVDRLLLEAQAGSPLSEEAVRPVADLLEALQQERTAARSVQYLGLVWRRHAHIEPQRLPRMVAELRQYKLSAETLAELERLAASLDQERAEMLLRIRGV
ncbi:MAG TPA: hypothetical protein VIS71_08640 [Terrimicrobium sp.]